MQYIYKYVDDTSAVVYVGITDDMKRRIREHKSDKLKGIKNPIVFYFPVKYRADAEMLETYLINHYGTGKYYNVSKTKKGDFSFFDMCDQLPWTMFTGEINTMTKPFVVSMLAKEEKIVEKTVFVDKQSTEGIIRKGYEDAEKALNLIDDLINFEETLIDGVTSLNGHEENAFVMRGLCLHKKRLQCARLLKRCYLRNFPHLLGANREKWDRLILINNNLKYAIEQHEKHIDINVHR